MNNSKNIYWINGVRALAIMAVFLSHVQAETCYGYSIGVFHKYLSPWYVNAFFFISGYLLFRKQFTPPLLCEDYKVYISRKGGGFKFLENIFYRIIIPTILFSAIEYVPNCFLKGKNMDLPYALYKTIGGGTYWFTSALAVSELIVLLMLLSRKKNIWFYFSLCVILGGVGMCFQHGLYKIEIWAFHRGVEALLFICSGGLYWKYESKIAYFMKWHIISLMLVAYFFILIYFEDTNPNISILALQPIGIVTTLLSCILLIELFKHLPDNSIMNYIGKNTLGFYLMSGALPVIVSIVAHKLVIGSYLWMMLTVWIMCLFGAYVIVGIINKWLPWMFDLRQFKKK